MGSSLTSVSSLSEYSNIGDSTKFQYLISVAIPLAFINFFRMESDIEGVWMSAGGRQFKRIFITDKLLFCIYLEVNVGN